MKAIKMLDDNKVEYDNGEIVDFSFPNGKQKRAGKIDKNGCLFDGDHLSEVKINGKKYRHPVYLKWQNMLQRCYSKKLQMKQPTYANCTICSAWKTYSNFERWLLNQYDWLNRELDKDLLELGNKEYSPKACCFVPQPINLLLNDRGRARGNLPIGVSITAKTGQILMSCRNGEGHRITKSYGIGHYLPDGKTAEETYAAIKQAHRDWKIAKARVIRGQVNKYLTLEHDLPIIRALYQIANDLDLGY